MPMTRDTFDDALNSWKLADAQFKQRQQVAKVAFETCANGSVIEELAREVAGLRVYREYAYRATPCACACACACA